MSGALRLETDDVRELYAIGANVYDHAEFDAARRAFDDWLRRVKDESFDEGYSEGLDAGYGDGYVEGYDSGVDKQSWD